jgi:HEAT repeat protein
MKVLIYAVLPLFLFTALVRDAAAQVQAQKPAAATTAFREARDLIGAGDWARAETALNRFITDFPKDRDVPAALYWLAFSLKQQNKFAAADPVLTRLIQQHPTATAWVNDARAMRVEIAPRLGNTQVIEQGVVDSDDEIRLAALQTLFETRPERAVAMAAEILKAGSSSSRLLKEGAISLLEDSETSAAIPLLTQVAQSDTDMRVRRKATEALGEIEDSSVIEPLKSIALQSTDVGVARAGVEGLAEQGSLARKALVEIAQSGASLEVRAEAVEALGEIEGDPAVVVDLVAMMAAAREPRVQQAVIEALGEIELPQAETALAEIARTSPNAEVRRDAVEALSEHETESAGTALAGLYDSEKDERVKEEIIDALEQTESRTAMRKLGQIAAKDPSDRLRGRAVSALAEFEDPEAAALIEQALKQGRPQ